MAGTVQLALSGAAIVAHEMGRATVVAVFLAAVATGVLCAGALQRSSSSPADISSQPIGNSPGANDP